MPAVMRLRLVCYFEILFFGSLLFCKYEYEVTVLFVLYVKLSSDSFCFEDNLDLILMLYFVIVDLLYFSFGI